ncbi:MAG TPA: hypothetical protein VNI77_06740 [Nitrososphaera sp.]|nr:hypothetical protein [Nitrososphaera sp.]
MSKRKETKRLNDQDDDIEFHNSFDRPIKAGKDEYSPYEIPKEDHTSTIHTFASDIDQQKMLAQIKSEILALREEVRSLAQRVGRLEKSR